ncbi:predicted protein [Scheffersomyces stipitis CBS 6054]|uniref:Opaque-phase-specific protein OP4 n=1 Tax=Scheffersomyces stipitis (strain ATCC 58785 / CBS 6054 / NBRC 10063 / NRRL Y-11545) TaxID=322104 RepID=A3GHL0_PICST|nr:predicted protein [Scheffersomyces stipitis CBS 6054]EAZ62836.1 predicted protein [Scheffersomyces stipitis CBS 6054]KAG2735877.1 hypothetical protein G9P44_002091 [Scheffersomyces stipitis]
MKLCTYIQILLALSAACSAAPVETEATTSLDTTEQAKLESLVTSLNQYNAQHNVPGYKRELTVSDLQVLASRSNIPIVDAILAALNDSGLANVVIDFVLLSPELLSISIDGVIFTLKSGLINLTDVLIALQKSGLILQVLHLALNDPEILPGLLRIGKELLAQNGINIFSKRELNELSTEVEAVADDSFNVYDLSKRESELLNDLFTALRDSGLAASVIQHLLTTPELAAPAAHFLDAILKSGALSLGQLLQALKESNLVLNLLKDILNDRALLIQFGNIVADRISKGLISKATYDAL